MKNSAMRRFSPTRNRSWNRSERWGSGRQHSGRAAGRALTAIVFLLVAVAVPGVYLASWRAERQPGRPPADADAESTQVAALGAAHALASRPAVDQVSDQVSDEEAQQARTLGAAEAVPAPAQPSADPAPAGAQLADPALGEKIINQSLTGLERFNQVIDVQLKDFYKIIEHPGGEINEPAARLVADDYWSGPMRPADLQEVFRDPSVAILRGDIVTPPETDGAQGASGFLDAVDHLVEPYRDFEEIHAKFKTFQIEADGPLISSHAYFHVTATSESQVVEQSATWTFHWRFLPEDNLPKLLGIEVADFEEARTLGSRGALFVDSTEAVLGSQDSFRDQLMYGIGHWRSQLPADVEIDFRGHHGLAIGDVNADGLDDIYVCQPHGLPNRMFVQQADGTVRDISATAGVDWLDAAKSALLIDLDNDGDQDLVASFKYRVVVMSNNGSGVYSLAATLTGPRRPHSMASADYDGDGDLDIFVCGFWRFDNYKADPVKAAFALPTPWHDANNGAPNQLYRNDGSFTFSDVTVECGLDQNNSRFSHAAGWEDVDNDGDQDLYVANDFGRNNLFRNDGGKFVDIAPEAGVEDQAAGMSVAWADYNKDGWMDLYVSNMFSSAGGRITYHREFQNKLGGDSRSEFRRHARGNTLFDNSAGGTFSDTSETAAVTLGRWAWSSNFIDFNNDGWEDIFVANGYVTNEDTGDL